jgi:hypothetical protein
VRDGTAGTHGCGYHRNLGELGVVGAGLRSVKAHKVNWADSIGGRNTGLVKRV